MEREVYQPNQSFLRVASACPEVSVADVVTNIKTIKGLYDEASLTYNASLVSFPEMSVTGYTLGDLVQQTSLLNQARQGLVELAQATKDRQSAMVVGLPLMVDNGLFNCAAVIGEGKVLGIVPKTNLPTYKEFYEQRWYQSWQRENTNVRINGDDVPFGNDLLFDIGGVKCGVEICEDLWVGNAPSVKLSEFGGQVFVNPSASPEQIGKEDYRRELVKIQSGRLVAGYVYSSCDVSESTSEIVMGGHQLIASNGHILNERPPFGESRLMVADIDIDHINYDRRKLSMGTKAGALLVCTNISREQTDILHKVERNPFLPDESAAEREQRLERALKIQANGLAQRMKASNQNKLVLGLSGGLDSTLALIVAYEASKILGLNPTDMIHTVTMPGMASSELTQDNAQLLAQALGVSNSVIPIDKLAGVELEAIGHDGITQDVTYENIQARARTSILFNLANLKHAIVLGTGDLSEIALGWCTYNADQQSHYNVNASIPKTMVKALVEYAAQQKRYWKITKILNSIVSTPISPELTKERDANISQKTEDIIGPYELHDFFHYYLVRWGDTPDKIAYLAGQAYQGKYSKDEVDNWLNVFITRFSRNQFKRENMPNGPKVGSVSLSPRGDWRMPPDLVNAALWS